MGVGSGSNPELAGTSMEVGGYCRVCELTGCLTWGSGCRDSEDKGSKRKVAQTTVGNAITFCIGVLEEGRVDGHNRRGGWVVEH